MKGHEVQQIIHAKYDDYCDQIVKVVQALPEDCRHRGDDSVLADVWEEFKYQIQQQESVFSDAYEDTIVAVCRDLVKGLSQHERDLLWLVSEGYFEWDKRSGPPAKADDVTDALYRRVWARAADEDLKVDPDESKDKVEE